MPFIKRYSISLLQRSARINSSLRTSWPQIPQRFSSINSVAPSARFGGHGPQWTTSHALMLSGLTGACVYLFAVWHNNPRRTATTSSTEMPEAMPKYASLTDMQDVCRPVLCIDVREEVR